MVKNLPAMWETWVRSLSWEDPLEQGKATNSQYSFLENSMDKGAWQEGLAWWPWGSQCWTWLNDQAYTTYIERASTVKCSCVLNLGSGYISIPWTALSIFLCIYKKKKVYVFEYIFVTTTKQPNQKMSKDLNRHFFKEDLQMTKKHKNHAHHC